MEGKSGEVKKEAEQILEREEKNEKKGEKKCMGRRNEYQRGCKNERKKG